MQAEVLLDIPDDIVGKLATGELERVGGVIRNRETGRVVTWLRETSPSPLDTRNLPMNNTNQLLGVIGHSASILNLGATIAFGTATLSKLSKIEGKLDIMNEKLDELQRRAQEIQWTIELGFANTLVALDGLRQHQEIELFGNLNSAANMAWSCQFLEPGSPQRITRIENAFSTASSVKEILLQYAQKEMLQASEKIKSKRKSYHGFAFEEDVTNALLRLRQAIAASSLCAAIGAEADSLFAVSSMLGREHKQLRSLLTEMAGISLQPQESVYPALLNHSLKEVMPATRVDAWAKKYDQKSGGLFEVLDMTMRPKNDAQKPTPSDGEVLIRGMFMLMGVATGGVNSPDCTSVVAEKPKPLSEIEGATNFINLIDGVDLDLDRLQGYQIEYNESSELNLSIQEYRDMLRLDIIPANDTLVCLSLAK